MSESVVEKCIEQVSNRFKLVLLASQRAHDLNTGASNPTQITKLKGHKNTIISLSEVAEKQVDTHELFYLLVGRCKEYMKGSTGSINAGDVNKLEKFLNLFNDSFNSDKENTDIQSDEIEDEGEDITDIQDSDEIEDEGEGITDIQDSDEIDEDESEDENEE